MKQNVTKKENQMYTLKITYLKGIKLMVFEKDYASNDMAYLASFEVSQVVGFVNVKAVKVSPKAA
jgi:hypothetical protein